MASTRREIRALTAPIIYLDGKRLKILPNSCTAELPGEVKGRAVSAGAGMSSAVYGYNAEEDLCKIKFELANTAENVELALDYNARARKITPSTLRLVEDTINLSYTDAVKVNKTEVPFETDGKITFEMQGILLAAG